MKFLVADVIFTAGISVVVVAAAAVVVVVCLMVDIVGCCCLCDLASFFPVFVALVLEKCVRK